MRKVTLAITDSVMHGLCNKLQMEKSKRKRGISLSHHATPNNNSRGSDLEESRVRQIVRPFAQSRTSTTKQPRFSSAPKPKIIFCYAQESAGRESTPFLSSAQSNSAFSHSSSIKQPPPTRALATFTPIATPKEFDVVQQPRGVISRRLFSNAKAEREEVSEVSTQTERKNYIINNQYGISQNQQNLQTAFAREEYEKLIQNRRKHLGISNKVVSYKQDLTLPTQATRPSQPFSKVELQQDMFKKGTKTTVQDLQSLQDMEKRLREIINICDSKLG